ncbi:collagen alpha-1(XVIII) chain-like [Thalassophryne amazonica]|uniref:collagen alpha-1(XVIII) chain-like n=1 Tax=Thalassophryne amazonica TaxID=390379 RepID=UPI001470A763|nr:collagen alpha-1(XVIII) chain-like [Thalassophryne amazonica]
MTEPPGLPAVSSKPQLDNDGASENHTSWMSSNISEPANGTSLREEQSGVSLLQLIGDPPPDEITQIYGPNNIPGYVFGPDANTGQLARTHLPSPFYRDFALIFHLKPTTDKGGIIFSITNAEQRIMYVGVKLSDVQGGNQNVILYYTNLTRSSLLRQPG